MVRRSLGVLAPIALALLIDASSSIAQTVEQPPTFTATRTTGAITLDGALDEPEWTASPVARGFVQSDPAEGRPATFDTDVRVLYTDEALYFGVFAHDDAPSKIVLNDLKKDYNKEGNDGFRILLDTFHDGRNDSRDRHAKQRKS